MQTNLTDELMRAEGLMIQDQDEQARMLLERLAEDAEEYVDRNCPVTESVQWFSFPTMFDRLCYRRVEEDPRELHDIGEPLDRLYGDLALACVRTNDYDAAKEALKQAVRWNPMNCAYRLDLADLFLIDGRKLELAGALEDPKNVLGTVGYRQPVDYTMVNGKFTVRGGKLAGIDETKLVADANRVCRAYLAK
jgi:tetratricopeptide (TPR) repeat protein